MNILSINWNHAWNTTLWVLDELSSASTEILTKGRELETPTTSLYSCTVLKQGTWTQTQRNEIKVNW